MTGFPASFAFKCPQKAVEDNSDSTHINYSDMDDLLSTELRRLQHSTVQQEPTTLIPFYQRVLEQDNRLLQQQRYDVLCPEQGHNVSRADEIPDPAATVPLYPAAAYLGRSTRVDTPLPLSTIYDIDDVIREAESRLPRIPSLEEPQRYRSPESPVMDSGLSTDSREDVYSHSDDAGVLYPSPTIANSNMSLGQHLWTIIYPGSEQYFNECVRTPNVQLLTYLTKQRNVVLELREDGAMPVETAVVKDKCGLLLFEIVSQPLHDVDPGTVFEGYGYVWCVNHPERLQTLIRIRQQFISSCDNDDSIHNFCLSFCEKRHQLLPDIFRLLIDCACE
ncbi:hypothetical protein B0H13DRAFT_2303830 [Mycena leptocephala]|nr:hypothetical protein B0H13DRAFT_2303830 [Mycena leptocephala]